MTDAVEYINENSLEGVTLCFVILCLGGVAMHLVATGIAVVTRAVLVPFFTDLWMVGGTIRSRFSRPTGFFVCSWSLVAPVLWVLGCEVPKLAAIVTVATLFSIWVRAPGRLTTSEYEYAWIIRMLKIAALGMEIIICIYVAYYEYQLWEEISGIGITAGILIAAGDMEHGRDAIVFEIPPATKRDIERENKELHKALIESITSISSDTRAETTEHESPCAVCLTESPNMVFIECGHLCICAGCYSDMVRKDTCPMCRGQGSAILVYKT